MVEEVGSIPKTTTKKGAVIKTIGKWALIFAVIGILILVFAAPGITWPWETTPVPTPLTPADVELYRFSDLKTNTTMNVELWIKNTGEETARDLTVFVRCRNQNGTILFMDELDLTWELLGANETCSATYSVNYKTGDTYVESTIEIRCQTISHMYLEKTEL
jgi:hypothetical protein